MTKKITLATIKSFIKKNNGKLFINVKSSFDGMTDGVEYRNGGFKEAKPINYHLDNNLGIDGAWFVGNSRDCFSAFEDKQFQGFEVYNSCGKFILAVEKP